MSKFILTTEDNKEKIELNTVSAQVPNFDTINKLAQELDKALELFNNFFENYEEFRTVILNYIPMSEEVTNRMLPEDFSEAFEILQECIDKYKNDEKELEKFRTKLPIIRTIDRYNCLGICPRCGKEIAFNNVKCSNCGQAVDWEADKDVDWEKIKEEYKQHDAYFRAVVEQGETRSFKDIYGHDDFYKLRTSLKENLGYKNNN